MKKLLLTSIAALFLLPGTAHAAEHVTLPNAMIGKWCHDQNKSQEGRFVYYRESNTTKDNEDYGIDCGEDGLEIRQDGDLAWEAECAYDKIEQTAPGVY